MAGNTFGRAFRVTTAGESHGPGHVAIIDGVPAGLPLVEEDLLKDLRRRRPGQSSLVSPRAESDRPIILSGVFEGRTTGAPIGVLIMNEDARPSDYDALRDVYRPGHADFPTEARYGMRDHRGGGRSSARETVSRVAAGAIARAFLGRAHGIEVVGYVTQVGEICAAVDHPERVQQEDVEKSPVRCPDPAASAAMIQHIEAIRRDRDSIGGIAQFVARGVPAGLGEPVFDKLKADLAKALFSLPAVMGVEYGAGFAVAKARGSSNNDPFVMSGGRVTTEGNRHGGMLGGLSTGMPILLRAAVKPTSSIPRPQRTVTRDGEATEVVVKGRHDPCLLPRFVPMGEAMICLVLADHLLRARVARASL